MKWAVLNFKKGSKYATLEFILSGWNEMLKKKKFEQGAHPKNWNHGVHPNFVQKTLSCIWAHKIH